MSVEDAVAAAWTKAGQDLGINVSIHGALHDADGRAYGYTVHIDEFGATRGTICVVGGGPADNETEALHRLAVEQGFYFSWLFAPYATYDRVKFIDTLNDWKWYGEGAPPEWYTGKHWAAHNSSQ